MKFITIKIKNSRYLSERYTNNIGSEYCYLYDLRRFFTNYILNINGLRNKLLTYNSKILNNFIFYYRNCFKLL